MTKPDTLKAPGLKLTSEEYLMKIRGCKREADAAKTETEAWVLRYKA